MTQTAGTGTILLPAWKSKLILATVPA